MIFVVVVDCHEVMKWPMFPALEDILFKRECLIQPHLPKTPTTQHITFVSIKLTRSPSTHNKNHHAAQPSVLYNS